MRTKTESEELMRLKREIAFQKVEIETLTAELVLAKNEHVTHNTEKQKRANELIIANKELAFQNKEKQKRADELIIANKELDQQYKEKKELTAELTIAYNELKKTEEYLRSYIKGLEEMMFMTSPKVRQPIAHILGVSNLLSLSTDYSLDELKKIVGYIKHSALSIDDFTKELTVFMNEIGKQDEKTKNNSDGSAGHSKT